VSQHHNVSILDFIGAIVMEVVVTSGAVPFATFPSSFVTVDLIAFA